MADGIISIDVELNEKEFRESLDNMGGIVAAGSRRMIKSIDDLSNNFRLLPSNINTVFGTVPTLVNRVISNIASRSPIMADTGYEFFSALTGRLTDAISNICGEIPHVTLEITEALRNDEIFMADAGYHLFAALLDDLPDAVRFILRAPPELVDTMVDAFEGLIHRFSDVGVNIVQGVWSGISGMASWLGNQVSNFFSGIINGVTSFLGIRSPSALFRDRIGKNIALGIGAGIADEMPGVARDMVRQLNTLVANAERMNIGNIGFANDLGGLSSFGGSAMRRAVDGMGDVANASPSVNITLEPAGDLRGFFEYLSMNIKRADYLSGSRE